MKVEGSRLHPRVVGVTRVVNVTAEHDAAIFEEVFDELIKLRLPNLILPKRARLL